MFYSVIAAKDGDIYHDTVEAANQEEAEAKARDQLAKAWNMAEKLQQAREEEDELAFFDAELDGFAVDPIEQPTDNQRQSAADPLPFDTDYQMNDRRAGWAREALEAFQAETGTDDGDAISDLIADLAHLCDRDGEAFGWSVRDQIERGLRAYRQEITDEEPEEVDASTVVGAFTEARADPLRSLEPTSEEA